MNNKITNNKVEALSSSPQQISNISSSPKNIYSTSPKNNFFNEKPIKVQQQIASSPVKSEFSNFNNLQKNLENDKQEHVKYRGSTNSDSESREQQQQRDEKKTNDDHRERSYSDLQKLPKSSKARVRISSVVENIETREHYEINRHSASKFENDEEMSDNDEVSKSPYELTRPMKLPLKNEIESSSKGGQRSNSNDSDLTNRQEKKLQAAPAEQQPKIMSRQMSPASSSAFNKIPNNNNINMNNRPSSSKSSNSSSSDNNKSDENINNNSDQAVIESLYFFLIRIFLIKENFTAFN